MLVNKNKVEVNMVGEQNRELIMLSIRSLNPQALTRKLGRDPNDDTALDIISWEIGDLAKCVTEVAKTSEEFKGYQKEKVSACASIVIRERKSSSTSSACSDCGNPAADWRSRCRSTFVDGHGLPSSR